MSFRELETASRNPRERLKPHLGCLERWGFIEFEGVPRKRDGWGSGRGISLDWFVRFTRSGKEAARIWPPLWEEMDERWKKRFGREDYTRAYESLRRLVGRLEFELPWGLPGGLDVAAGEKSYPPKSPEGGETNHPPPLSALLSQALLGFALEFNQKSRAPLVLCGNVIRVLSEDNPARVADLPALTGGSPEAVDIDWRIKPYVVVESDPNGKRGKVVRLSPAGASAKKAYYRSSEEIEAEWENRFGTSEVRPLRLSLEYLLTKEKEGRPILAEGLVPPDGVARAGAPVPALGRREVASAAIQRGRALVDQTRMFVNDPKGSLPHFPMWDFNRGFGP
jgi:hypothetical protein